MNGETEKFLHHRPFSCLLVLGRDNIGAPDRASPGILAAIPKRGETVQKVSGVCNNIPKSCDALPAWEARPYTKELR